MFKPNRSMPTQRMSVRAPGGASLHKSFRLTKPVKMKFIARGFGKSFIPEKFQKTIKAALPREAKTKEERFFLRQTHSDQTLTSSEQMKKFSKGFLQEAHEEGAKLRPGLNARQNESEQSQKLLKSYQAEAEKIPNWQEKVEHRQKIDDVRQRLGILHAPPGGTTPGNPLSIEEPTPLGHGWGGSASGWDAPDEKTTASPKTSGGSASPSLGGGAAPFLGGNISAVVGRHATGGHLDTPASVQVQRHAADALYLGQAIGELDAARLTNRIGLTVESRRSVSPIDNTRTYALVIVEDDYHSFHLDPKDIPRPRTALIIFGSGLSAERQAAWKGIGATEIIAESPTFETVLAAIERYVRVKPTVPPAPSSAATETGSGEVHELPI